MLALCRLGMILHELATNAVKYGAWSVPAGAVTLGWEYRAGEGENLDLRWLEERGPAAQRPERFGFGLQFVRQSTEYELQGRCETEFGRQGFRCRLVLPADGIKWRPK